MDLLNEEASNPGFSDLPTPQQLDIIRITIRDTPFSSPSALSTLDTSNPSTAARCNGFPLQGDFARTACILRSVCKAWAELVHSVLSSDAHAMVNVARSPPPPEAALTSLVSHATSLLFIDLSGNYRVTQAGSLVEALGRLPRLIGLHLDHCDGIPPLSLSAFAQHAAADPRRPIPLRSLSLASCGRAVGDGAFITNLVHLEHLNIAWCRNFNPPPGWLRSKLTNLKVLTATGCENLGISEFCDVPTAIQQLSSLNLAHVGSVDNAVLGAVARMPCLVMLTLAQPSANTWESGAWTEDGIQRLKRSNPGLDIYISFS